MNIQDISYQGIQVGLGIAVIPAIATTFIACSKIIFVNIIADIAMRILTANAYSLEVQGVSFVSVPFLWKVSFFAAITGGVIIALSFLAVLVHSIYQRHIPQSSE